MKQMKPYVILNCAMSLDGVIGRGRTRVKLSNHKDMVRMHKLRATVDAIAIGISTILVDNPKLTLKYAKGRNPLRVVVDSRARTHLSANVLNGVSPTVIVVTEKANKRRVAKLKEKARVIVCGSTHVDLKLMLSKLARMKVKKLMLEGGGHLNRSMIEEDLVDEMNITVAPRFMGEGIHITEGLVKRPNEYKLNKITRLQDQVVLNYTRK